MARPDDRVMARLRIPPWPAILVVVMALIATAAPVSRAAALDVCPSGCTYSTIQAAVDAAATNDTIEIGEGVYAEQITVSKNLTLNGAGSSVADGSAAPAVISASTGPLVTVSAGSTVTIANLDIQGGTTNGDGGGIHNAGTLYLSHVGVSSNSAVSGRGGGIYSNGSLIVEDSVVTLNTTPSANFAGGAGILAGGSLTVRRSTISSNRTMGNEDSHGGGGVQVSGTASIEDSIIKSNTAKSVGGGVHVVAGSLTITRSTIGTLNIAGETNVVDGRGGGIYVGAPADVTVDQSLIWINRAAFGAGMMIEGSATIQNTTITTNQARAQDRSTTFGGGIYADGATVSLDSVTVAHNEVTAGGGGIYSWNSSFTVDNSIIGNNVSTWNSPDKNGPDCNGSFSSSTVVLVEDPALCAFVGAGTVISGADPGLAPYADNGGPTYSHALVDGSPALDAGSTSLTSDQRGLTRPSGSAPDIGAFERQVEPSGPVIIDISEVIAIVDGADLVGPVLIAVLETIQVSDAAEVLGPVVIDVSESIGVSDGVGVLPSVAIDVSEVVVVSDDVGVNPPVVLVVDEQITVSDGEEVRPAILIGVSEQVTIGDSTDASVGQQLYVSVTVPSPGDLVEIAGDGFMPGSLVTIELHSEPLVLGSAVADELGAFSTSVTIPPNVPLGAHTIVARGVAPDGSTYEPSAPLAVEGSVIPGSPRAVPGAGWFLWPGSGDFTGLAASVRRDADGDTSGLLTLLRFSSGGPLLTTTTDLRALAVDIDGDPRTASFLAVVDTRSAGGAVERLQLLVSITDSRSWRERDTVQILTFDLKGMVNQALSMSEPAEVRGGFRVGVPPLRNWSVS